MNIDLDNKIGSEQVNHDNQISVEIKEKISFKLSEVFTERIFEHHESKSNLLYESIFEIKEGIYFLLNNVNSMKKEIDETNQITETPIDNKKKSLKTSKSQKEIGIQPQKLINKEKSSKNIPIKEKPSQNNQIETITNAKGNYTKPGEYTKSILNIADKQIVKKDKEEFLRKNSGKNIETKGLKKDVSVRELPKKRIMNLSSFEEDKSKSKQKNPKSNISKQEVGVKTNNGVTPKDQQLKIGGKYLSLQNKDSTSNEVQGISKTNSKTNIDFSKITIEDVKEEINEKQNLDLTKEESNKNEEDHKKNEIN